MKTRIIILLFLGFFLSPVASFAMHDVPKVKMHKKRNRPLFNFKNRQKAHNKWVAAGLDVSLGLFGVHRLYLGTKEHVPVMYTLTLGGGGVLILADLGLILFTKDIEKYTNNPQIFMWSEKD